MNGTGAIATLPPYCVSYACSLSLSPSLSLSFVSLLSFLFCCFLSLPLVLLWSLYLLSSFPLLSLAPSPVFLLCVVLIPIPIRIPIVFHLFIPTAPPYGTLATVPLDALCGCTCNMKWPQGERRKQDLATATAFAFTLPATLTPLEP